MKEAADKKKYKVPFWKTVKKHWMLLAMLAPAVIYVVIFAFIKLYTKDKFSLVIYE